MRKYATALFIAASLTLTACSGDGEPRAGDSPPPTKEDIAYYDCLKDHGVKITHTDYGAPRVDKDDPTARKNLPAAQEACADKQPPMPSRPPADPQLLAIAREEATCLRAEGVTWYLDPDPKTGLYPEGALTTEQASELRTKHTDAVRKCRQEKRPGGGSGLGG